MTKLWRHLADFVELPSKAIRAYPGFVDSPAPARSYDVGFALIALCSADHPEPDVQASLRDALTRYRLPDGHYAKLPPAGAAVAPPIINEYETYLLFGAMACLAADARR